MPRLKRRYSRQHLDADTLAWMRNNAVPRRWVPPDYETARILYESYGDKIDDPEFSEKYPARRSRGWWWFASPEPRDESVSEAIQLWRMGHLSDAEKCAIQECADEPISDHAPPFRRTDAWWLCKSSEKRLIGKTEARQLCEMHDKYGDILTEREQFIREHGYSPAPYVGSYCPLTDRERKYLGMRPFGRESGYV